MVKNQVSPRRSALDMTKATQHEMNSPANYSQASNNVQHSSSDSLFKRRHGEPPSTIDTLALAFCLPRAMTRRIRSCGACSSNTPLSLSLCHHPPACAAYICVRRYTAYFCA
eukprot:scaffold65377_cov38-Prasinocladus_malaysianus.AAC.3